MRGEICVITKKALVAEIEKVLTQHLGKLYQVIKPFEEEINGKEESVTAKLHQIRISTAPDFSTRTLLDIC
jgi:hypothetical protein